MSEPNSPRQKFLRECEQEIATQGNNADLKKKTREWLIASVDAKYSYHFAWMGVPIIQYPQDMIAMQEILWRVKPDLLIETGVAHGGSLVFYASILKLIGEGTVVGIDIDIRKHNREAIEAHPMFDRITLMEGSSIDPDLVARVKTLSAGKKVIVVLDSNHTHEHVLAELEAYAPLVTSGSYCVVMDTLIEDMPADFYPDRPWTVGNNAKTAVNDYVARHPEFSVDITVDNKVLISVASGGYLKRA
jgi:cephalosporin hydroxylase